MTASELPAIPVRDVRDGGPLRHAVEAREVGRALRDDCLSWLSARGPARDADARCHHAALADAFAVAVCRRDRRDLVHAWFLRNLVSQRLLPVGLHRPRARRRCAVARAHARLAVPRARAPCRGCPNGGTGRRVLQRHLAGFRGRSDRHGAGAVRGLDQPGADVAANAKAVDAAAGHDGECRHDLAIAAHAAGPDAAARLRNRAGFCDRAAPASRRRRSRGR